MTIYIMQAVNYDTIEAYSIDLSEGLTEPDNIQINRYNINAVKCNRLYVLRALFNYLINLFLDRDNPICYNIQI